MDTKKRWYVVYIKPRKEEVVKRLLNRIGIETFYPKVLVRRGRTEKIEPLFPLYMFVRFSLKKDFLNVKYCRGIRRVVHFGDNVPYIPDEFIESIKNLSSIVVENTPNFNRGDLVRVTDGPFRGLIGKILKTPDKNDRVILLLKTASLCPKVSVPAEYLSKIS